MNIAEATFYKVFSILPNPALPVAQPETKQPSVHPVKPQILYFLTVLYLALFCFQAFEIPSHDGHQAWLY